MNKIRNKIDEAINAISEEIIYGNYTAQQVRKLQRSSNKLSEISRDLEVTDRMTNIADVIMAFNYDLAKNKDVRPY